MSYQTGYDPVAMAAYMDAMGGAADGIDNNGMTMGGAPGAAGLTVSGRGSYGLGVQGQGTAFMILAMIAGAYLLLHFDRLKVRV